MLYSSGSLRVVVFYLQLTLSELFYALPDFSNTLLDTYQQVLGIRQKVGDSVHEEIILYRMGRMYHRLQKYPQALVAYQKAVSICQEIGTDCLYSRQLISFNENIQDILSNIGEVYLVQAHYTKALTFFQQTIGDDSYRAFTNIGLAYDGMKQDSQAFIFFDMAIKDRKCAGYGDGARVDATLVEAIRFYALYDEWMASDTNQCNVFDSQAFAGRAEIYRKRGQYSNALEDYRKALKLFTDFGMQDQQAAVFNNIGVIYKSLGDYSKALKSYQQALAIRKELKDKLGEATNLNNIGEIYRNQGQYTQALESYRQAFVIFEALEPPQPAGGMYWGSSNRDRTCWSCYGMAHSDATLDESVATRDTRFRKASTLHNMGVVHDELGQHSEALKFYAQALTIRKVIQDPAGGGATLNNMGLVYQGQQQHSTALKYYQNSLALRRAAKDRPGEATTLNNIGLVHEKLGQPALGIEPIQQALSIFRELGDKASEGNTLDSLGTLYKSLGKFDKALHAYQQALGLLRAAGNRPIERVTLSNIGDLFKQQNQPELAIAFYKQSVNLTEGIREELRSLSLDQQESYTQTIAGTYRSLADLLLQQDRILEAQQVLELLKLQEFSDSLQTTRGDRQPVAFAPAEQQLLEKLNLQRQGAIAATQELKTLLNKPEAQRTEADRDRISKLNQLQQQMTDDFRKFINKPEITALIDQLRRKDSGTLDPQLLEQLQNRIGNQLAKLPNAALLYPLILDDRLELILITPDSAPLRRTVKIDRITLNQAIADFSLATQDPRRDPKPSAQRLYDILIQPLASDLQKANIKTLLYSPDRRLRYVPLPALHDGKQWLAERFQISYITAASVTDLLTPRQPQPKVLAAAISDNLNQRYIVELPAIRREFGGLPNVLPEVTGIAAKLPNTRKLLDRNFTVDAIAELSQQYNILHFATHGSFERAQPELSFILFGDKGKQGRNFATLRDIGTWRLNADLVVLSACETGLAADQFDAKADDNVAVMGLGYQFEQAGARATIASLWLVNDASTALLMQQFYTNLATGKMTKAEALKTVQQDFIHSKVTARDAPARSDLDILVEGRSPNYKSPLDFSHPYYWAPFILIGNSL
jgi:CHAT domain-containing protein/tetratricopeptide (TPR) repeat protein